MKSCPNCGSTLPDPPPPFCPQCGQETQLRAPRVGEFLQQFGGAYLSTEGALWRTLRGLARPGWLTAEYLRGRRRHYVLPLRLYLTVSVIVLLLMRVWVATSLPDTPEMPPGTSLGSIHLLALGDRHVVGLEKGVFVCRGMPERLCRRVQQRVGNDPQRLWFEAQALVARLFPNLGTAFFLLPPVMALLLRLLYLRRGLHTTEHLVFALHLHAAWFVLLPWLLLPSWVQPVVLALGLAYLVLAQRRVYGGRWWALLMRTALLLLPWLAALGTLFAGVAMWSAMG